MIADSIRQCRVCGQYHADGDGHLCAPGTQLRRISCVEGDPGYVADGYAYRVLLDGEQAIFITADAERGEILRYRRDDKGECVIEDDCFVTEIVRGHVEIRRADGY